MKKYLLKISMIALVGLLIAPEITFAAWWNPFTWRVFNKWSGSRIERSASFPSLPPSPASSPTEIEGLKKEIEELKRKLETPNPTATPVPTPKSTLKSRATPKPTTDIRNHPTPVSTPASTPSPVPLKFGAGINDPGTPDPTPQIVHVTVTPEPTPTSMSISTPIFTPPPSPNIRMLQTPLDSTFWLDVDNGTFVLDSVDAHFANRGAAISVGSRTIGFPSGVLNDQFPIYYEVKRFYTRWDGIGIEAFPYTPLSNWIQISGRVSRITGHWVGSKETITVSADVFCNFPNSPQDICDN